MSRQDNIAKHRLGIARKMLALIEENTPLGNEDGSINYQMSYMTLKRFARYAIKEMNRIK